MSSFLEYVDTDNVLTRFSLVGKAINNLLVACMMVIK